MKFQEDTPDPEEPVRAEEPFSGEPSLPDDFTLLGEISHLSRARRRRAQRVLVPPGAGERAALLADLSRRAFPSLDFFLLALLSGAILGAAYLLDMRTNSQALFLLGLLAAPTLTPWVGLTLAAVTGSWRFFSQTLLGLLAAALLIFLSAAAAGFVGRLWLPLAPFFQSNIRSHLWWLDLFLVALGAAWLAAAFVRSEQRPVLPGVIIAYGLFMPLSASGFGLGIGAAEIFQNGLLVFLTHLALATLTGSILLAVLRFKPARAAGYLLPVLIGLLAVAGLVIWTGLTAAIRDAITSSRRLPATPIALVSLTPGSSPTPSRTATQAPSATPTPAPSLEPAPSYAVITSPAGGGALVRTEPGSGTVIIALLNGTVVQVLPEVQEVGTAAWARIRMEDGVEGWVLQSVLTAATLTPSSTPSPTLTPTFTPTP